MAVVSKDVSARLVLADSLAKQVASFSGVQINIDPDSIMAFRDGVNALVTKNIGHQYLYITSELTKTEA